MRSALIAMVVAGAVLIAACGSAAEEPATTGATDQPADGSVSSTAPEGPTAPDFTLALGEDGVASFTLSQEAKPVYMVFWAEW